MYAIGEFANHGRVSVRMLRHYDAIGLLRPAHVDPATGYRYYRTDQLADLNRIVALKDLGFTLEQVRAMVAERISGDELRGMLRLRRAELATAIEADRARLRQVEARLRIIESERLMPSTEIQIKTIPPVRVAELTGIAASYSPGDISPVIRPLYDALIARLEADAVDIVGPALAYYEDATDGVRVHAGFPVAGEVAADGYDVVDLPGIERAATTVHRGSIYEVVASYDELARWIDANGQKSTGYAREVYLGPDMDGSDVWVVELQEPVAPR